MKSRHLFLGLLLCLFLIGTASAVTWVSANGCWTATDGSYNLVKWNATGVSTWTVPATSLNVEYLVIGGGGGGAANRAGGGAGGFKNGTGLSVSGIETITIGPGGAGGAGGPGPGIRGTSGTASSLTNDGAIITSDGGGYGGGGAALDNGGNGGSGGGGHFGGVGGTATAGFDGQNGSITAPNYGSGGGGGAGALGKIGTSTAGGDGGKGLGTSIEGTHIRYAGGGAGSTYSGGTQGIGVDGGGTAAIAGGTAGTNGLGGGGGAGGFDGANAGAGGKGGDGVVVVRWLVSSLPVASFALNKLNGTQPLTVQFSDASTNTPTSWAWGAKNLTPGNNTWFLFSTAQNPSSIFNYGNWSINLTSTNTGGSNISTQVTWVNVSTGTAFTVDFAGTPLSGYANLLVSFVDMSTGDGLYDWAWDFGDTGTSALRNPSHTYTVPGSYDVKLTVKGFGGTTDTTKTGYVSVLYPFTGYSDPLGYILADGADNKIHFYDFKNTTDGKAIEIVVSGSYEVI